MSIFSNVGCCAEPPARASPNVEFWHHWVFCTKIEVALQKEEETDFIRFFRLRESKEDECEWLRVTCLVLTTPPDQAVATILDRRIKAFSEWRQFWTILGLGVPTGWPTYHSYMILEVEGEENVRMLLEKKSSRLEMTFGCGELSHGFMEQFRATLVGRNPLQCVKHIHEDLYENVTVRQLLSWIDGPLARRWQAYHLFQSNCQHFTQDLQEFLRSPGKPSDLNLERQAQLENVLNAAVSVPQVMTHTSDDLRNDRSLVLQVVSRNGIALQYVPENFLWDWSVTLAAVKQNGCALQFVPSELRQDWDLCVAAVRQDNNALCYVPDELQMDEKFLLAAREEPVVVTPSWRF